MCNVTLRRVHVSVVAMETQHLCTAVVLIVEILAI